MAFSMHTHSGQFCPGHAKDSLEEIVLRAISLKMHLLGLTEHMPRDQDQDLYPEEIAAGNTIAELRPRHEAYIHEAQRLRAHYADHITLLIGFEGEWIRASSALAVRSLLALPGTDFFIGSVHHVHEIPIDYDRATYTRARDAAGGSDERLFEDYFDAQWEMLNALRPTVVGHLDLVRLFADRPDAELRAMPGVWGRVRRNLEFVVASGALLEVNSSALRKGLREPYPSRCVCEEFTALGGKFTLSDDSHGVAQVGLNFGRVLEYLKSIGVSDLYYLERQDQDSNVQSKLPLQSKKVLVTELDVTCFPSSASP